MLQHDLAEPRFCVLTRACSEFLYMKTLRHRCVLLLYGYTTTRISYVTYPQGFRQKELHLAVRFSGYDYLHVLYMY